jgi:hypothetical protein
MKTGKTKWFIGGAFAATLVGLITFTSYMPANAASHELIYAVDQNNNLFNFYSDTPQFLLTQYPITGLQLNEEIRGLDYYNGTLYGLGSIHHLYTINPNDGSATMVGGTFSPILNGASFGFDNDPTGVRVASNLGQNLLVNRTTGAVTPSPNMSYSAGDPFFGFPPRVDALAYDDAAGIWYAGDTLQNSLATFNPTTGVLSSIGMMGIDASTRNGLDISPFTGIMYMGTPAASSDPQANLYIINKLTGMATLVGQIDVPMANTLVRGLTVVPEPSSFALLGLGAFGLWFARRRHQ